jgi:CheY-like chemotaxis protein
MFDEPVVESDSKSDEAFLSPERGSRVRENMIERYQIHGQSARILVVDDQAQVAEAIQQCLECEPHYEVRVANDGLDALEQYVAWQPDCIVTDLLMPYMDGYQVMRSLSAAGTRQMPAFVVISALPQRELPEQHAYPREKSVVFIDKPFQIDHLLDAVERALV